MDVRKIAKLAHLEISDAEVEMYTPQMAAIVGYVEQLNELDTGDVVVIHDAGAHGHAMGFNYNGKLRSAELLLRENGTVLQIRRAETVNDYLATLEFKGLKNFK